MATSDSDAVKVRLRQTFDLFEAGLSMKRAAIRRAHPDADDDQVDRLLREWLATRPGARHGDGVGRLRPPEPLG